MDGDALLDSCDRSECPCQQFAPFKDKRVVLDYKTSNGVYSSMFGQMAFYRKAKVEEFPDIVYDGSVLLRIGKDDKSEFEPFFVFGDEMYEDHLALFKHALDLKDSVDKVDAWMQGIKDEVREKAKAAKAAEKAARMLVACDKSADYKGKRLTKCFEDGKQCISCAAKYAENHAPKGDLNEDWEKSTPQR
jgi:hypothetical protein